ncbi:MAG: alpha,alpha-trehalose-phosphate synthase (UDP-forming) [Rhodospirillales bacterium]|nr:alpha,alpha-trehalose-phosphate synthase (UDP-forming) [Rhodospirillales bacterium]
MARLVIVSNRVAAPRELKSRAGGLAVALRDALTEYGGLWFGWSGETREHTSHKPTVTAVSGISYATLDLTPEEHRAFYVGYANSTLWPLCHYRLGLVEYRRADYEGYVRVNAIFAKALVPFLEPDTQIWIHDYHFIPLAAELRKLGVKNRIGFFLHIPFPGPEVMTALPGHASLLAALCQYDVVGLQTERDVRALQSYIEHEAGGRVGKNGQVDAFGHRFLIRAFPISIDTASFRRTAEGTNRSVETQRLTDSLRTRNLILGVDRLDYSKGLPERFAAFQDLLTRWPEWRTKVVFMQIAPVSRGEVAQYRALRRDLDSWTGRINGHFAEFDWAPVRYLNRSFSRKALAGFYRVARIGLVTPLRDGMNLVAKEYIAAQAEDDPGVLVLSQFAGAAQELTSALIVNPLDADEVAEAMHRALTMPLEERRERWEASMAVLRAHDIGAWKKAYLRALGAGVTADQAA